MGTLMFMPLIYPFEPWRIKHNQHHAHTNKCVCQQLSRLHVRARTWSACLPACMAMQPAGCCFTPAVSASHSMPCTLARLLLTSPAMRTS